MMGQASEGGNETPVMHIQSSLSVDQMAFDYSCYMGWNMICTWEKKLKRSGQLQRRISWKKVRVNKWEISGSTLFTGLSRKERTECVFIYVLGAYFPTCIDIFP